MLRVGARIRACTVIERLPLVAPPLQQWEVQWELAVRQKIQWRLSKAPEAISKDLKHFVTTEFLDAFYDGETVTPDDQNNNLKSTNRKLDQTLFLLVKHKNGEWEFPTGDCFAEESLREAAERSVADMFEQNLQVYFTGIAPLAHHQSQDNEDKVSICIHFIRA
jgi:ADP-ribose pyrophosphatase YjhB (NUDIX family)